MALGPGNLSSYNIAPGQSQGDIDLRRRMALAMMQQGMSVEPVQAWTQGAARALQGALGGWEAGRIDAEEQADKSRTREILSALMGGGGSPGGPSMPPPMSLAPPASQQPVAAPPSPEPATPPAPSAPVPGSPGMRVADAFGAIKTGINTGMIDPQGASNNLGASPAPMPSTPAPTPQAGGVAPRPPWDAGTPSGPVGAPVDQARGGLMDERRRALVYALAQTKAGAAMAQPLMMQEFQREATRTRDLVDPRERAARGIPEADKNAYQVDATGKIHAVNPQPYAVNLNNQQESEFSKEAGKLTAKRYNDLVDDVPNAKQMLSDIDTLRSLGTQIGTGKEAQIKAALGPYAELLGVKIDKLGEIQAYEAIINRLAPNLRVKGSGAQSDFELRNFMKSLPTVGNTPEGNEISSKVLEGLYNNKIAAAEIASRAMNKEITPREADKLLRDLPDPMKEWRYYQKSRPTTTAPVAGTSPSAAPQTAAPITSGKTKSGLDWSIAP